MNDSLRVTRRGVLVAGGAVLIGAASGCATSSDTAPTAVSASPTPEEASSDVIAFYGAHQAGVETPAALHQSFIGMNLRTRDRESAEALLLLVSDDAARLTQGEPALGDTEPEIARNPARLTITVGLGAGFFEAAGVTKPEQLRELPSFETDAFEQGWEQTDLMLQVGSDDPLTLAHTIRMLTKDLATLTEVAWIQDGFISPNPSNPGSRAGRNLMGQVDGTINPAPQTPDFDEIVWIDGGEPWVSGGTVLILRRIRLLMDRWDALDQAAQELVIGRHRDSGAPLGKQNETDPMPWDEVDSLGLPVIPMDAHARVAHATDNQSSILRRPYNYDAGFRKGKSDVGLLFAAYMRDPATSFIPMQRRIAESDAFNVWNTTIGSATYFIPAGARDGGVIGEGMFA